MKPRKIFPFPLTKLKPAKNLPKNQILTFENPDLPLIEAYRALNPFPAISDNLKPISKKDFQINNEKSLILDKKTPLNASPDINSSLKKNTIKNHIKAERNSLFLFENFTGRKVSEYEYYSGSPLKSGSQYHATAKIDRIKRFIFFFY